MEENNWSLPASWHGLTTRQRDFGAAIARFAAMYSSPVIMSIGADPMTIKNATGFLLKLGERRFLVTNAHVINEYRTLVEAHGDTVIFQFGGQVFDPKIVDQVDDDNIDLAVIDVGTMEFVKRAPGYWGESAAAHLQAYAPAQWPLPPARKGEATVTLGWPRKFRTIEGDGHVEFAAFPMLGQLIDSVEESWFAIPFERDQLISSDFDPTNAVIFEKELGGMSGSPVFALHRDGVHPLQLVGIVRSYGEGLDVLYCTRADLIGPAGAITN